MKKSLIAIITIFIITILLIVLLPNLNSNYTNSGKLYISKIVASNTSLKEDNYGEYSDYIEIYNGYSFPVNLKDYHLSDSEYRTKKWTFPDITIKPKSSLVVYASGNDTCDIVDNICHTNFKLNSKGEILTLTDNHGNIISKVSYPEQYPDTIYGYVNGKYTYLSSDGKEIKVNNAKPKNYKLEITEYMTHNKNSYYDSYGNYYDWVEIHNISNEDYLLEDLYISDDNNNLKKYRIPTRTIKKDAYLIIHLAGRKEDYENGIYADFSISDNDKEIIISNGTKIIDRVPIVILKENISYGKVSNKWSYFTTPTPGMPNDTASFITWGGNDGDN